MRVSKIIISILLSSLLVACSSEPKPLTAAPLGDQAVLEKLAKSWEKVSNKNISVSPMSLAGNERKHFLEMVFADNDYSYSATLHVLATQKFDKNNQAYIDMAELVLMPHRNPKVPMEAADIYKPAELFDVAALERALKQ
jgi:accessory colonization factor AcfC